ncbi:deoxynucleoside triphosphate triphosphohydrolase SAMHD1 isoform X1 [Hydra vulgaris]|uniref:deoxynucleoside triphosphate triphosphohydrolase SAMHD1 isoform X1 n=1 Tax=Hydra vulgaris TaxID=6087 RepID=UPI001F5EBBCF|nr:deoxynucleoside triphosphate triphosphohydrolase SAMHD1-like isoform X1 [Hydra vulgaris]XP_047132798.1 deoxynucleoside triphosphate triphosphohydrolase SAMHD1-like isoform X1 [Hydra vulgaris]
MDGLIKLFVGSLPNSTNNEDLKSIFSKFGTPHNAYVVMEKEDSFQSCGFGFVEFEKKEEADAAITELNGVFSEYGKLLVKYFDEKSDPILSDVSNGFVGNMQNVCSNVCQTNINHRKRKLATVSLPFENCDFQSNKKFAFEKFSESSSNGKVFNDPIHGHFELPSLLVSLIDTQQFQRLRHIKQLSGAYMVFPGASHNRFEHSLGVAYLAGRLCQTLQKRQPELNLTHKDMICVQIAGLCHDLGHGPFSHLFETAISTNDPDNNWMHEQASVDMFNHMISENNLKNLFEENGFTARDMCFICELIAGPTEANLNEQLWPYHGRDADKSFLYEIVANKKTGVDVDKWDYFLRDCHHLGISNNFDYKRYMKFARVISVNGKLQICTRDKEVMTLYDMFHTRNSLHRRAYQHKTVKVLDFMISEALIKANDHIFLPGTDGKMVKILDSIYDMKAFTFLNDEVLTLIQVSTNENLKPSQNILRRIQRRDLYKYIGKVVLFKPISKKDIHNIRHEITDILKVNTCNSNEVDDFDPDDIVIHVIGFDYGMKDSNPVDKVFFYTKLQPDIPVLLPKDQVSRMLPEIFAEQHLRCYCKRNDITFTTKLQRAWGEWKDIYMFKTPDDDGTTMN